MTVREYVLDVAVAKSPQELHDLMARTFNLPDYYGRNWDAFDECFSELPLPATVRVTGMWVLERRLSKEAHFLRTCLAQAQAAAPQGQLTVNVA